MRQFYADLHVHIGRAGIDGDRPVKITAARDLTVEKIVDVCKSRKGLDIVGIVDAGARPVISDVERLLERGKLVEITGGGLRSADGLVLILGYELESKEVTGGRAHYIGYFGRFHQLKEFAEAIHQYITNPDLSSQQTGLPGSVLWEMIHAFGGLFVPAHAFTPHRGVFGCCCRRLGDIFPARALRDIAAIELGLSADTYLADHLAELERYTFLTNSDAHSLAKIGREYNELLLEEASFTDLELCLRNRQGRRVLANYGLDPRLGKYHRTFCPECRTILDEKQRIIDNRCPVCGSEKIIRGVYDRIRSIADGHPDAESKDRPPYYYQVPLEFIPGVGKKTISRLVERFGSEIAVLRSAGSEELASVVGEELARKICRARSGRVELNTGGGGYYGRVVET